MRCTCLMLLLLVGQPLVAAETDVVADMHQAFAGQDRQAKRAALRALSASKLQDDVVLPLLVAAVADRQAHADAVAALRSRTGLAPPVYRGQSHHPGYPPSDHPASWQYWLSDWRRARAQDLAIERALSEAREADAAAERALAARQQSSTSIAASDQP